MLSHDLQHIGLPVIAGKVEMWMCLYMKR